MNPLGLLLLVGLALMPLAKAAEPAKPVLLYSRYFNAAGETRYLPDGTYREVLKELGKEFEVRVSDLPLRADSLAGIKVVLIANPNDLPVAGQAAPHHCSPEDIAHLNQFVREGGGLVVMGNQDNHNLEMPDFNGLLAKFGLKWEPVYTDIKSLVLPKDVPLVGGLTWAYYSGNRLVISEGHQAKPQALVTNDLKQKLLKGDRDPDGVLLALAEPGKGRVVVITDAGSITDDVLSGKGVGGVAIKDHDNLEIFLRLTRWVSAPR